MRNKLVMLLLLAGLALGSCNNKDKTSLKDKSLAEIFAAYPEIPEKIKFEQGYSTTWDTTNKLTKEFLTLKEDEILMNYGDWKVKIKKKDVGEYILGPKSINWTLSPEGTWEYDYVLPRYGRPEPDSITAN